MVGVGCCCFRCVLCVVGCWLLLFVVVLLLLGVCSVSLQFVVRCGLFVVCCVWYSLWLPVVVDCVCLLLWFVGKCGLCCVVVRCPLFVAMCGCVLFVVCCWLLVMFCVVGAVNVVRRGCCAVCWCCLQLFAAVVVRRRVVCGVMSGALLFCGSFLVISLWLFIDCLLVCVLRCCVFAAIVFAGCDLVRWHVAFDVARCC